MLRKQCSWMILCIIVMLLMHGKMSIGQEAVNDTSVDTVILQYDEMLVFEDSVFIPSGDTTLFVPSNIKYKVRKNSHKKSQSFYDSVYKKTQKKKLTREIYNLVLSYRPQEQDVSVSEHSIAKNEYEDYRDKVIRSIRFVKVDLLDGSVDDTSKVSSSGFSKILNKTHINTHDWILKKFLLVKPGDKIIPSEMSDNERIIRNIPAIEDVNIMVIPDTLHEDFVDIVIITKDVFPVGATASVSSFDKFSASLWSNNSLGLAYVLGGRVFYDGFYNDPWGYELYTKYHNFLGSFIDGSIDYVNGFDAEWLRVNFSRKFLTPFTKYAGGLNLGWGKDQYSITLNDTLYEGTFETNYQDLWLGRSILLGDKEGRNNLILSARFEREKFSRRPFVEEEQNVSYHNKNIYYAKIGYANFKFYKTRLIRSYGISENIPYGVNTGLTFAYLTTDFLERFYWGANVGAGKYFDKFGYLAANVIIGGFYNNGSVTQGIFESNALYYTPLIKLKRNSIRNFLRLSYRTAITYDIRRTIDFDESIRNLNEDDIAGLSVMTFKYEFIMFTPWYFYGFRFAPFAFADVGLISNTKNVINGSRAYSALGFGFRIRNESLAFKSIILSFGFLPNINNGNGEWFYSYSMGEDPLISVLSVEKPYILRRDLIFPY